MKFINDTMMHHPLHLHGHFFRLLNGQGDFAPLKHTVDIPPMARETIEFHANEQGDWIFHCHLLYHMKAGMSRVISYEGQGPGHQPRLNLSHMDPWIFGLEATLQSNLTHGQAGWRSMRHDLDVIWEYGFGDDEYELDLQWKRTFSPDWATLAGYRFTNEHGARDRAFGGVQYRLPLLAEGTLTVDTEGDLRPGLAKTFQLTDRWSFINEIEYDTNTRWEWNSSLEYRINKRFSITGGYHTDHGFGGGILFRW